MDELFDGTGPGAAGLGARRLSEPLTRVLRDGDDEQRLAARASAEAIQQTRRTSTAAFHTRIAQGEFTEDAFLRGRALAERLGYATHLIDALPDRVLERFIGLANPFVFGLPQPGETVIDVGSGAGFDAAIAAMCVGTTGRVIGLDTTFEMARTARTLTSLTGAAAQFLQAPAELLPIDDGVADLVISNGVFNLCDRPAVVAECRRVLKPGGRLQFGDMTYRPPAGLSPIVAEWRSLSQDRLTVEGWSELLLAAGFRKVRAGPVVHPELTENRLGMVGQAFFAEVADDR